MIKLGAISVINQYIGNWKGDIFIALNTFGTNAITTTIEISETGICIQEKTCEIKGGVSAPLDMITESELIGYMEKRKFKKKIQEQLTLF